MAVVVRCPGCRGAAQVGPEAVGLLVVCPRCSDPFVAVEEATPVTPAAQPPTGGTPRSRPAEPAPRSRRRRTWAEPVTPPAEAPAPTRPNPHDIPDHAPGGLPLSVMIGLALLPFTIPMLWLGATHGLGQQSALSVATPVALAVSASVLCLAVVFTVDWSPITRLKGVLMLVGLAHFAALSLFYLKTEWVTRAERALTPKHEWTPGFKGTGYQIDMPGRVTHVPDEQPLPGWELNCHLTSRDSLVGDRPVYVAGVGVDPLPREDEKAWFAGVRKRIEDASGGRVLNETPVSARTHPGREWRVRLPVGEAVRRVRVFRTQSRVYYVAADVPDNSANNPDHARFFNSFQITAKE